MTTALSFLLVMVNSVSLYIEPHGRVAYWISEIYEKYDLNIDDVRVVLDAQALSATPSATIKETALQ